MTVYSGRRMHIFMILGMSSEGVYFAWRTRENVQDFLLDLFPGLAQVNRMPEH